eukprot:CAMPEP_0183331284 /NCGR_PEP_ID=MMETSP0164_2-20130417/653_1 /TAXON_ID=221442 /ORGANISM="Coccolithus pelagicus ssp braarudi, Strain PLY182g" /LENGTH=89 /DNA_ID=CAMNT_0025499713 /DNA_START=184 /DNA_END=455 /DNA_ORIENTATION=-
MAQEGSIEDQEEEQGQEERERRKGSSAQSAAGATALAEALAEAFPHAFTYSLPSSPTTYMNLAPHRILDHITRSSPNTERCDNNAASSA